MGLVDYPSLVLALSLVLGLASREAESGGLFRLAHTSSDVSTILVSFCLRSFFLVFFSFLFLLFFSPSSVPDPAQAEPRLGADPPRPGFVAGFVVSIANTS